MEKAAEPVPDRTTELKLTVMPVGAASPVTFLVTERSWNPLGIVTAKASRWSGGELRTEPENVLVPAVSV